MKKKKIAVLHSQIPFMRGGAENLVNSLTRELRQRGYNAETVSMPFKWYPTQILLDQFLMWRLVDLSEVNGQKIDLVIANKVPNYMIQHSNKVIWLMHQHRQAYDLIDNETLFGLNTINGGAETAKKIRQMDQIAISEAKRVFSISKNVSSRLKKYNGIPSTPLYHPPALAGRYYSGEFEHYILSVGRLDPGKRTDLAIRSLQFCSNDISLKIAGKGAEYENLRKLAVSLGVDKRVQFLGFVTDEDLLKLYSNALGVYFSPIDEDYGYVTLEAFLSKKPIITCNDSGGVLEFASHNENALITQNEPEAIGQCFDELYNNKGKAKEMGENGFVLARNITWDAVIDKLTETI